jgi:anti-anti-sigma factor
MSEPLFSVMQEGPVHILELRLPTHLDSGEFDRINDAVLAALAAQPAGRWVVDLSSLTYAGSSLLGLMVNARQRVLEEGGRLALCGLSSRLMRIFTTCCLERLFDIRNSRAEAIRASNQ